MAPPGYRQLLLFQIIETVQNWPKLSGNQQLGFEAIPNIIIIKGIGWGIILTRLQDQNQKKIVRLSNI